LLAGLRLRTFLPSLTFPNNGNLGLPLAAYAFGEQGLVTRSSSMPFA
jgi:malate permease and related proteins